MKLTWKLIVVPILWFGTVWAVVSCDNSRRIYNPTVRDTVRVSPCAPDTIYLKCPKGYECRPCKKGGK